jgi:glycosyltransferase involved in cell wall biosynthesis
MVLYLRGLVPYVRIDILLKSIHTLLQDPGYADVRFKLVGTPSVVSAMAFMARKEAIDMNRVDILPVMSQKELVSLLQKAAVMVSPSITDGTPNSMLEAMACGVFPGMSDLESIREWINPGQNGLLFDPARPQDLIRCLKTALDDVSLRQRAQGMNMELIRERADFWQVMPEARRFIARVAGLRCDAGPGDLMK